MSADSQGWLRISTLSQWTLGGIRSRDRATGSRMLTDGGDDALTVGERRPFIRLCRDSLGGRWPRQNRRASDHQSVCPWRPRPPRKRGGLAVAVARRPNASSLTV